MEKNFILIASPLFAAMMLSSCSDDKKEAQDPTLSISPTTETIDFSWQATESYTFEVKTNQSSWTAEPNQGWCTVTPDYDKNTFTVTASPNDSQTALPEATITVKAGEATPVNVKAKIGTVAYSVYVVGESYDGNDLRWCYWKDGVRTVINEDIDNVWHSSASNGSVYMLGCYNGSEGEIVHCYWKDGERVEPANFPQGDVWTWGIAVSNGSVHITGNEYTDVSTVPFHWKDGVRNNLSLPDNAVGEAGSIVISDGSVYIGGYYEKDGFGTVACFWKDGVRTDLEYEERVGQNVLIAVERGSVYVSGDYNYSDTKTLPYLWNDGEWTTCQDPGMGRWTYPVSMAVENGSAHIVGYGWNTCYWKDGVLMELDQDDDWYSSESIVVVAGSVYLTGGYWDEETEMYSACYWKDGVRVELDTPKGNESAGVYIMVEKI